MSSIDLPKLFRELGTYGAKLENILAHQQVQLDYYDDLERRCTALETKLAELKGEKAAIWRLVALAGCCGGLVGAAVAVLNRISP
jgi:hypothetical protein